eukprot:1150389-Pelagomonas_calceolata.AAC.3
MSFLGSLCFVPVRPLLAFYCTLYGWLLLMLQVDIHSILEKMYDMRMLVTCGADSNLPHHSFAALAGGS